MENFVFMQVPASKQPMNEDIQLTNLDETRRRIVYNGLLENSPHQFPAAGTLPLQVQFM